MTIRLRAAVRALRLGAAIASMLALASAARANDANSALGAGGLELLQSSDIRMVSEELHIARAEVRVRYRFRNLAAEPKTVMVSFPFDASADFFGGDDDKAVDTPETLFKFSVTVNGAPVTTTTDLRALDAADRNVTERLRRSGLPIAFRVPWGFDPEELPAGVGLAALEGLERDGLLKREGRRFTPLWRMRFSHVWTQSYGPGEEQTVEHRYEPRAGNFYFAKRDLANASDRRRLTAAHCLRKPFIDAIAPGAFYVGKEISYILKTATTWAGPIGDFRLVVDKGSPRDLVSLCGFPMRRTGPTTFESRRRNFTPRDDLTVLFLIRGYD